MKNSSLTENTENSWKRNRKTEAKVLLYLALFTMFSANLSSKLERCQQS